MTKKLKVDYDVVVIGSGSAGYAAARTAAALGARTAIIEAGPKIAGLCILRGCMPSKTLLASASRMHAIRSAGEFGIDRAWGIPNLRKIIARKRRIIQGFEHYRNRQIRGGAFDFIRGRPAFVDARTIRLPGKKNVTARHFIVCTGSKVSRVPVEGLWEARPIDSDQALDLEKLPRSLAVLGGGPIAVELGQYFSRLGSRVTILQRSRNLLSKSDPDLGECLGRALEKEGIRVLTGVKLQRVRRGRRKTIEFSRLGKKQCLSVDEILYALGRSPNTEGLGLGQAGVKLLKGAIHVDSTMRSSVPAIFAAGDVNGEHEVVHIAIQQGEIAARNAVLGTRERYDSRTQSMAVFTEPQVATVGLSEGELKGGARDYESATYPFDDHGKSIAIGEIEGFVKIIAEPRHGRILGAQVIGPYASDLIHELIAFIHLRGSVHDVLAMPHYHPTLAEIWTYPAEELAERLKPSGT